MLFELATLNGDIEPVSREELRELLNDRSIWNTKFDLRDTAIFR